MKPNRFWFYSWLLVIWTLAVGNLFVSFLGYFSLTNFCLGLILLGIFFWEWKHDRPVY